MFGGTRQTYHSSSLTITMDRFGTKANEAWWQDYH
jgi:hypothetical protein